MTRTVTANVAAALSAPVRTRRLLLQLDLPTGALRWCSRETVTVGGVTWTALGFRASGPAIAAGGRVSGSLEFPNADRSAWALFGNLPLFGRRCLLWELPGSPPFAEADAVPLPSTILDGTLESAGAWLRLGLIGAPPTFSPRYTIDPDVFHHVPAAGTKLTIGGHTLVIERR